MKLHTRAMTTILFLAGLALALLVFAPGLSGPFLFDDLSNLRKLGENGGISGLETFLAFVFSGQAGPLGRPLSLATFALDGIDWPTDPRPFKYTNLLIHTLNGVLVFALCRWIAAASNIEEKHRDLLALAAAGVWLLHPMQLSTMMLVVQRMNQLATLFTLASILVYLHGRTVTITSRRRGYVWMSAAITAGLPLAVLSKESGILLCAYVLVLEGTLLTTCRRPTGWTYWATIFLAGPLLLLAGHFAANWHGVQAAFASREFTQGERLLTQPRILLEYLYNIALPSLGGSGLFHDDYRFSTGPFAPPQTAFALLALLAAGVSAVGLRRRYPLYSFGVLWFLGGHALESSFLSLELYFEHRNYLPMLGPIIAIVYGITRLSSHKARLSAAGLCAYIALLALLSYQSASTWGNQRLLANTWAIENPRSARAQQFAADYWVKQGELGAGLHHLLVAADANPHDLSVHTEVVLLRCLLDDFRPQEFKKILDMAETGSFSGATLTTIDQLGRHIEKRPCGSLNYADLHQLLNALLDNPKYAARASARRDIWYAKGKMYFAQRELTPAIEAFDKAYEAEPELDIPLLQAGLLLSAGLPQDARRYYMIAKQHHEQRAWHQVNRSEDLAQMKALLDRRTLKPR